MASPALHRSRHFAWLALLPALALAQGAGDPARRGLEIALAADAANAGFGAEKATVTMELINAYGDSVRRKLTVATLEGKDDGDKSKVEFESPADVKGTKLLTWTHRKRENDQWLYLPAIKRIKRISGANTTGSFMGSELSYEDLASTEVEKFTYRFIDEPRAGERETYRIERYPLDKNSGYAREIIWLDKEYQNPLRVEYYDRKNVLLKIATLGGYGKHGRFWRASSMTIDNVQTKKRTVLVWELRQLPAPLAPQDFDSARLED